VCVLAHAADKRWMQHVAREMNLSETAFLFRHDDAWDLRWFTPTVEVDLCGHATLAAAHVLWEDGHLAPGVQAKFDTLSGRLSASAVPAGRMSTVAPFELLQNLSGSLPAPFTFSS
jgi:PhzF family phenazine biosynthesis protein